MQELLSGVGRFLPSLSKDFFENRIAIFSVVQDLMKETARDVTVGLEKKNAWVSFLFHVFPKAK
jgi:hypothetical protein